MQLQVLTLTSLMQRMAASVQGSAAALIDLSVGSVLRAMLQASASVALWMQWLILQVLTTTRAATSSGTDLDSWMADFSLARLPGAPASGKVTFSRFTVGIAALIPAGTVVRTSDGLQSFIVVADPANTTWTPAGYCLPALQTSATVPVIAVITGVAGNVQSGMVTMIVSPIVGVDQVTNVAQFIGGVDQESDASLRARFVLYINSRTATTRAAIAFTVASVQLGLRYAIAENVDSAGSATPGMFVVTVDDGSGSPPASLIASVQAAIDLVRPIGSRFAVQPPTAVPVTVELSVALGPGAAAATAVLAAVESAIVTWIASLGVGGTLAVSKIDALAHAADPAVLSVTAVVINGAAADLVAPADGVLTGGVVLASVA